jgi:hypothetical protein
MQTTQEATASQTVEAFSESIEAIARHHRQIAFSLCMERLTQDNHPPEARLIVPERMVDRMLTALRAGRRVLTCLGQRGVREHAVIIIDAVSSPVSEPEASHD